MAFKVAAMEKRNLAEDAIGKPVEPVVATAPLTPTMKDPVGPILNYSDPIAKQAIEEQRILLSKAERNRINKDSLTQLANATAGAKRTQLCRKQQKSSVKHGIKIRKLQLSLAKQIKFSLKK